MSPSQSRRTLLRFTALGALAHAGLTQDFGPPRAALLLKQPGSALVPLALCRLLALGEHELGRVGIHQARAEEPPWAVLLLQGLRPERLDKVEETILSASVTVRDPAKRQDLRRALSKFVLGRNDHQSWKRFAPTRATEPTDKPKTADQRELNQFRRGFVGDLRRLSLELGDKARRTETKWTAMARLEEPIPGLEWVYGPRRARRVGCGGGPCGTGHVGPKALRFLNHYR